VYILSLDAWILVKFALNVYTATEDQY